MSRLRSTRRRVPTLDPLESRLLLAIYLKFGEIKGDVQAKGRENWIELDSIQFGSFRPLPPAPPRAPSEPAVSEIHITKLVDSASPKLFQQALSGDRKTVKIDFVKAGGDKREYIRYTLEKAIITSFQTGGSTEGVPVESFSLNFRSIKVEYKEQDGTRRVDRTGNPALRGFDLNGDGTADPVYFNVATLRDLNGDGIATLVAAGPTDAQGRPLNGLVADLNGDDQPDPISPVGTQTIPVDIDNEGTADRDVPFDFDGDGLPDPIFPFDVDGDNLADWLVELRGMPGRPT
jgi:type VI secretion system secreted protein Hcp